MFVIVQQSYCLIDVDLRCIKASTLVSLARRYGLNEPAISARLEKAVQQALDQGYRTGDIMGEGCQQVSCSDMGKKLAEFVAQ